ncbi:MAG: glycosyltransferase family 4 protein [Chthonomonas sp.]|nr:glycosyltransferase family 4 protein [Chthonomonas sp.]
MIDFADVVPVETDPKLNKGTSQSLIKRLDSYDLVHSFGYRMSWALADAFGDKKPWVYTAYDMPGSTHDLLMERLNKARAGYCCSEYVRKRLGWYGADFLKVTRLGLSSFDGGSLSRETCCLALGLDPEQSHIVSFSDDAGLVPDVSRVQARISDANIVVAGDQDRAELFAVASLVVFPALEKGASMCLLHAMAAGAPVMVPEDSGLAEYVDDRATGLWFDSLDALTDMIASALQMPIRAESMAQAAQIRVQETENLLDAIDLLGRHYRKMVKQ